MKRLTAALLRLYPRHWRDRYGEELECLLEDTGELWTSIPDILMEATQMRLSTLNWRHAVICALAGLAVAAAISFRLPPRYTSTAIVRFEADPQTTPEAGRAELDYLRRVLLSRASLSNIIQTPGLDLYKDERHRRALHDVITEMRERDLQVEPLDGPHAGFQLRYTGADPSRAAATVERLAQRLVESHATRRRKLLQLASDGKIEPLLVGHLIRNAPAGIPAPPQVSESSTTPLRLRYALLGLTCGFALWVWFTVIRCLPRFALWVSLTAIMAVAASYAIPFPYTSDAVVAFDSPETLQALVADSAVRQASQSVAVQKESDRVLTVTATDTSRNFLAQRKAQEYLNALVRAANSRYSPWENSLVYPAGHWVDFVEVPTLPTRYSGADWRGATAALGLLTLLAALGVRRLNLTASI